MSKVLAATDLEGRTMGTGMLWSRKPVSSQKRQRGKDGDGHFKGEILTLLEANQEKTASYSL